MVDTSMREKCQHGRESTDREEETHTPEGGCARPGKIGPPVFARTEASGGEAAPGRRIQRAAGLPGDESEPGLGALLAGCLQGPGPGGPALGADRPLR